MDKLHVYLDWINIMSYDFFNSLTSTTGHHAGLYRSELAAATDRNADASVKQHLAAGIPARKLVLGAAFYGRGFAGVKPQSNGLNQSYERYEGDHSYTDLAENSSASRGSFATGTIAHRRHTCGMPPRGPSSLTTIHDPSR